MEHVIMSNTNTPATEPVASKEKTIIVEAVRGIFPENGVRVKPGELVEVPQKLAQKYLNSGAAKFPDDED